MADPCDGLAPRFREICKCQNGMTLEQCNKRRVAWGIVPLSEQPGPVEQKPLTTVERVKSATATMIQTVWRYVSSGEGTLSNAEIEARLAICKTCDQFEKNHCKLCGCACQQANVSKWFNKLAHRSSVCPHDPPKWNKIG